MPIKIISVGKKHESWVTEGISLYQQRLRKPFVIDWHLIPHSAVADKALAEESEKILAACKPEDFVMLLDERGNQLTSPGLSKRLQGLFDRSQPVTIIIGGAYGVDASVTNRANFIWSLSDLVFPHQLVRLLLVEQIYRAQSIANGEPYHHE